MFSSYRVGEIMIIEVEFKLINVGERSIKEVMEIFIGVFLLQELVSMWECKDK
jgi:hypothetical protein